MKLTEMSAEELAAFKAEVQKEYDDFKAQGLSLNMARGKPSAEQLNLTEGLLTAVKSNEDCFAEDGTDCRNYGGLDGLDHQFRRNGFLTQSACRQPEAPRDRHWMEPQNARLVSTRGAHCPWRTTTALPRASANH